MTSVLDLPVAAQYPSRTSSSSRGISNRTSHISTATADDCSRRAAGRSPGAGIKRPGPKPRQTGARDLTNRIERATGGDWCTLPKGAVRRWRPGFPTRSSWSCGGLIRRGGKLFWEDIRSKQPQIHQPRARYAFPPPLAYGLRENAAHARNGRCPAKPVNCSRMFSFVAHALIVSMLTARLQACLTLPKIVSILTSTTRPVQGLLKGSGHRASSKGGLFRDSARLRGRVVAEKRPG